MRQFQTQAPILPRAVVVHRAVGVAMLTMSFSFSDFGEAVTVAAPPSSEVAHVSNQVIQAAG